MAHPADLLRREVDEELALLGRELRLPELRDAGALDPAAQILGHELHPVADAERRDAELEDPRIDLRRAFGVDRRRPTGEDERERVPRATASGEMRVRDELRVDATFPNAPGDQLRVLAAEVQNEHRPLFGGRLRRGQRDDVAQPMPIFWACWSDLALGLDRRREHDLGLLEVVDRLVATGRHRRPERAHQVQRPVVLARGADDDLLERCDLLGLHAGAARERGMEGRHAPVVAAARSLLRLRERRADHDRVGAAGDRLRDVAARAHAAVGDHVHVLARLQQVLDARGRGVGDRSRLRDAHAEHSSRRARVPGPDADEHALGSGAHQVQRGLVRGAAADERRDRQRGDELLQVQRMAVRGDVLGRDDGSLDDEDVEPRLERELVVLLARAAA